MIGIYRIINLVNGKSYIGQSTNIKRRWNNHRSACFNTKDHAYDYPIYKAMRKYGLNNFKFEVLEECKIEDLDSKEREWINYFDTLNSGYNQSIGGNGNFNKLNNQKLISITNDIRNTSLSLYEIATKHSVSYEMVTGINTGRYWTRDITYPIRKRNVAKICKCNICGKIISRGSELCKECLDKSLPKNTICPSKEELLNLVLNNSMLKIGKTFGVSDNTVRKWCKSYGLPFTLKDIKEYKSNLVA